MRIQRIVYDADAKALVEARLSSEVFEGARVPLADVGREERAWLTSLVERALTALLGEGARHGAYVLSDDEAGAPTVARQLEGGGAPLVASTDEGGRAEAARLLRAFVETTSGALLVDEGTSALQRGAGGDAPA